MGMYNWVVVADTCPICGQDTEIECQVHVASSAGGDVDGRFCNRVYKLGERMRWYRKDHPEFEKWKSDRADEGDDCVSEDCRGTCRAHGDELRVVIMFCDLVPFGVVQVRPEDARRREYPD